MEEAGLLIQVVRETHETPTEVAAMLRSAGGLNRFGEPNFRCMWGWNRLGWIGGRWEDRDASGNVIREVVELRQEPKYDTLNRWHIERWLPPESYGSPESWHAQTVERVDGLFVPALGPYPSRGDYESCFVLQDAVGGFIQLTPSAARQVARAIEYGRAFSSAERRAAIDERIRREEKQYDGFADSVLSS